MRQILGMRRCHNAPARNTTKQGSPVHIHMAAVFFSLHGGPRGEDFHHFVHHVYTTESLRAAYSGKILPCAVDGDLMPDNVTRPPANTKPAGRPPNPTCIPSRGERNPEDSPIVCSNCGRRGHNRRTCRYVRRDE